MTEKAAAPGQFRVIGRRDDSNETVISSFSDVPPRPKLSDLCRSVLLEMGQRDPLIYEIVALVYAQRRGGAQVVLDQTMLRRFVYAHWGRRNH